MVLIDTFYSLNSLILCNLLLFTKLLDLITFIKLIDDNLSIQKEVRNCKNGYELSLLLKKYKCENLFDEIKSRSRDLAANHWPWANKIRADRKKYFDLDIDKK